MGTDQIVIQKSKKITKEGILNCLKIGLFCVLLIYILQPIVYILLSHIFMGKLPYFPSGFTKTYSPSYYAWHRILIYGCSWILFLLIAIYSVISRPEKVMLSRQTIMAFIKSHIEFILFGILFLWLTITLFFSQDFIRSRDEYVYYICYVVIFISIMLVEEKYKKWLLEAFLIVGTIISSLVMLHDGFGLITPVSFIEPQSAIFANRNYYGYYVAIITAISAAYLYKEKNIYLQIVYGISFAINEFALLITLTRGAFLAVVVALVIMLIVFPIQEKKVSYKLGIIPAIFIAVFLILEYTSITEFTGRVSLLLGDILKFLRISDLSQDEADSIGSGRIRLWKQSIEIIKSSPIFGVGIDNTTNPHNEFLQLASQCGIPALILYVCALGAAYIKLLIKRAQLTNTQLIATVGAIAYSVSSFFGVAMSQTIPFYIIVLALALSYKKQETQQDNAQAQSNNLAPNIDDLAIDEAEIEAERR